MSNTITKIRLIVTRPSTPQILGTKTEHFIGALSDQPQLDVEVVEKEGLPHFSYNYKFYRPTDYSPEKAQAVHEGHLEYYQQQVTAAKEKGQIPFHLAGRFHELSLPFYQALTEIFTPNIHNLTLDQHLDSFGRFFMGGGFNRFAIDTKTIDPAKLTLVGIPRQAVEWKEFLEKYIREADPDAIDKPHIFDYSRIANAFYGLLYGEMYESMSDYRQYVEQLESFIDLARVVAEELWVNQSGINWSRTIEDLPNDGNLFLNFDADVGDERGALGRIVTLRKYLLHTVRMRLMGIHLSELDSHLCAYNPSELAQLFAEYIAMNQTFL